MSIIKKEILGFIQSFLENNNNNDSNHMDINIAMSNIDPYFSNSSSGIQFVKNFTRGFIPKNMVQTFSVISSSNTKGRLTALKLLNIVQQLFYDKIWKPRCEEFIEWEHSI